MWSLLLFSGKCMSADCRALNTSDVLSETEKASTRRGDHKSSGPRSIYKLCLIEVLMVILWSLKFTAIDYENSRGSPRSPNLSTWAWRTLTMSSLNDLHCRKDDTSVTAPFSSMETTLTGMATVRPVRIAVLIISVSWIWKKGRGRMRESMSQEVSRSSLFQRPECSGLNCLIKCKNSIYIKVKSNELSSLSKKNVRAI